jgi:hypothetical protein
MASIITGHDEDFLRVCLIDFEVAIQFLAKCLETECVSMGRPLGGSFSTEQYARPHAPEFASGIAYGPFKMFGNRVSVFPISR